MTPDQRIIAASIDFLARCHVASLEMEAEYIREYHKAVPDDASLPAAHAWEAACANIVGFSSACEKSLMRMVLLACGRTPGMLPNDQPVDTEDLRTRGACSVRSREFVVSVAYDPFAAGATMTVAPVANLVEDRPACHPPRPMFRRKPIRRIASMS